MRNAILSILAPLLCLPLGCMSSVPPGEPRPTLDSYRVGDLVEKGSIDDWEKTFIQSPGTTTYSIINGTDSGKTVTYDVSSLGDSTWKLDLLERTAYTWKLTDDGLHCEVTVDAPSGSTSTFDPPLPVIPRTLEPGKPVKAKGRITVTHTDNPSSQMASGTWTISILHDADVTLKIDGTDIDCTRIYSDYDADLGLATVKRRTWDYYAKDHGWIATVFKQTVTKVIIPEHTSGTWIRCSK